MDDTTPHYTLEIRGPAPVAPMAVLGTALDLVWPGTTFGGGNGTLTFHIPRGTGNGMDGYEATLTENAEQLRQMAQDDTPGNPLLGGIAEDGTFRILTDSDAYRQALAWMALSLLTDTEGAANYVEQEVHTPDPLVEEGHPPKVVFTAAWSTDQTPAALLAKTRRDLDEARQTIAALEARLASRDHDDQEGQA